MPAPKLAARVLEDALSLQRDLADTLAAAPNRPDAENLDEVQRICQIARILIDDRQCLHLLEALERRAESFFIADDEVDWAWHTPERYAQLRELVLALVRALGLRLRFLQIRQHSAEVSARTLRSALRESIAAARTASALGAPLGERHSAADVIGSGRLP